jgi:hypothetical protein
VLAERGPSAEQPVVGEAVVIGMLDGDDHELSGGAGGC